MADQYLAHAILWEEQVVDAERNADRLLRSESDGTTSQVSGNHLDSKLAFYLVKML